MKKIVALIAALLIAVVVAPPAEAAKRYKVSIAVSATSITLGSSIRITGRVSPKAVGKTVTIQKKRTGEGWKTEAKVKIKADGSYSYTDRPTTAVSRQYRAYKPKKGSTKAGYSKVVSVRVSNPVQQAASITIGAVTPRSLDAGQVLSVSGRTSANLRGKTVVLQRLNGSSWSTLASGKVSGNATFALSAKVTQAGASQKIRAYVAGTPTTKPAASAAQTYTVYGWYYLSELPKIESSYFGAASLSIAGVPYLKSMTNYYGFAYGKSGYAEWGLNYKCTQFRATIGLADTSYSGSTVAYVAKVDALEVGLGTMTNGQSRPVSIDLTSGYRLRLESQWVAGTRSSGDSGIDGAWGDARMRCAL